MVEAWPSASFVVPKPDLLLEILVVALDAPAHLGDVDEPAEGRALGQRCEPVFAGLFLAFGPFDQQRLLRSLVGAPDRRSAHAHAGKARCEPLVRAFAPRDRAPGSLGQAERQLLGAHARPRLAALGHRLHLDRRHDALSIANHHASLPIAYRLYLPEAWVGDAARRKKACIPEEIWFQTKPEIALDQVRAACAAGVARGVVLMDASYGSNSALRGGVSALA